MRALGSASPLRAAAPASPPRLVMRPAPPAGAAGTPFTPAGAAGTPGDEVDLAAKIQDWTQRQASSRGGARPTLRPPPQPLLSCGAGVGRAVPYLPSAPPPPLLLFPLPLALLYSRSPPPPSPPYLPSNRRNAGAPPPGSGRGLVTPGVTPRPPY